MKKLFIALLAFFGLMTASSQTVTISPLPQQISWGGTAFANS